MRVMEGLYRRFAMATLAGAVGTVGLLAFAGPASASTTISSCPPGTVGGTATISPAISHTNSNTTPSSITSSTNASGCQGKNVLGGTITSTLTTLNPTTGQPGPANCTTLLNPPPAGTVLGKGTFSATWSNSKTSTGTAKIKSTGPATPTQFKVVEKVTGGFGFLAGHTTKITGVIQFAGTVGNCVTTDISMVRFDNATTFNFVQS
jgi:hypothetical protein